MKTLYIIIGTVLFFGFFAEAPAVQFASVGCALALVYKLNRKPQKNGSDKRISQS